MGILRLYLAFCVVSVHAGHGLFPWGSHNGRIAVQIFYIFSGFYMNLILSGSYSSAQHFYGSRFWRIFPAYWAVFLLSLLVSWAGGLLFQNWLLLTPYWTASQNNGWGGVLWSALSNLTLWGQDSVLFLRHAAGGPLVLTDQFRQDPHPLWHYQLLPQCWTVSLELTFYLLCPILIRWSARSLVLVSAGLLLLRFLACAWAGMDHDPWTKRFFPFELPLFLAGMLAHRYYRYYFSGPAPSFLRQKLWTVIGAIILLAGAAAHNGLQWLLVRGLQGFLGITLGREIGLMCACLLVALPLPWIFHFTRNNRLDRWLGENSYPVYLGHYLVVVSLATATESWWHFPLIVLGTALLSILILVGIVEPTDRLRHRWFRTAQAESTPARS